jgi:hypothetical protein
MPSNHIRIYRIVKQKSRVTWVVSRAPKGFSHGVDQVTKSDIC